MRNSSSLIWFSHRRARHKEKKSPLCASFVRAIFKVKGWWINNKHEVQVWEQLWPRSACVLCVLGQPWQQQHVSPAVGLRVSSELRWYPHTSPAHQSQCTCPHWCRWTHVHEQPGHPHKVPRVTVRDTHICEKHTEHLTFKWILKLKDNYNNGLIYQGTHTFVFNSIQFNLYSIKSSWSQSALIRWGEWKEEREKTELSDVPLIFILIKNIQKH